MRLDDIKIEDLENGRRIRSLIDPNKFGFINKIQPQYAEFNPHYITIYHPRPFVLWGGKDEDQIEKFHEIEFDGNS